MSYFDPHRLYYHSNRKTHKGQIIQKRFVDHDSAFTKEDLDRSFRVLKAYGYYVSRNPPIDPICKTISFSRRVNIANDDALNFSDLIDSTAKNLISLFDENFFSIDPSSVSHFYLSLGVTSIKTSRYYGTISIYLHDSTEINLSSVGNATTLMTMLPYNSNQIQIYR